MSAELHIDPIKEARTMLADCALDDACRERLADRVARAFARQLRADLSALEAHQRVITVCLPVARTGGFTDEELREMSRLAQAAAHAALREYMTR